MNDYRETLIKQASERHARWLEACRPTDPEAARASFQKALRSLFECEILLEEDLEQAFLTRIWGVAFESLRRRAIARYEQRYGEPFHLDPSAA